MEQLYSHHFSLSGTGGLCFSGAELTQLAQQYGTPLYVMSESALRENCRRFTGGMARHFSAGWKVAYASKALCAGFLYPILQSEGMHADVVSGCELYTALKAGFPAQWLHFHGNNKSDAELTAALEAGIGSVVIDNMEEIARLDSLAGQQGTTVRVLFRVKPGVEAHTHASIMTGHNDSKFGFGIDDGEGERAARAILAARNLTLVGIHCHIGSQIFGADSFCAAAQRMVDFLATLRQRLGVSLPQLILGGGFGVRYMPQDAAQDLDGQLAQIAQTVTARCSHHGLAVPEIVLEPGRAIVADAGVTLYTVGGVKDVSGGRCYVTVDGSMADNPRFALYEAQYDAAVVARAGEARSKLQTIAGRCCESGDMITRDVRFQPARAGDILCVFTTGAYNYAMASNYNRLPRPAMALIGMDGKHRLVVRRESYEDLVRNDVF